ncbi:MAG: hypothetical protein ACREQM_23105 [Candidatus Dormibacteraceae bacterium]
MDDLSPRRTSRTPILVLAILLVAVLIAATFLLARLWSDDQQAHRAASNAQAQVKVVGTKVSQLEKEVSSLKQKAANPTVEIWNTCSGSCRLGPDQVLLGGVPDTFVLHFAFTSSAPVTLSFLTFHQWTQFDTCGFQASCVTTAYPTYPPATTQAVTFSLGAGCAGYLYVLTAAVPATLQPNVSATYQPASTATGECAAAS